MAVVKLVITVLAVWLLVWGLWDHDAGMILAGFATAAIWPLISADIDEVAHEELLDRLWDEDE